MQRSCFPPEALSRHGLPLLRRLRCRPLPGFSAPIQPSDSLVFVDLGSGLPLPSVYPGGRIFFSCRELPRPRHPCARACRVGDGLPAPRASGFFFRGKTRVSQVPGSSSSCVPRPRTPPAQRPFTHLPGHLLLPSGSGNPWAPDSEYFEAGSPRPTRSRDYASPTSLPSSSQVSLSTWWAPWSRGFRTPWMTHRIS